MKQYHRLLVVKKARAQTSSVGVGRHVPSPPSYAPSIGTYDIPDKLPFWTSMVARVPPRQGIMLILQKFEFLIP